jgi:hypothetical protein
MINFYFSTILRDFTLTGIPTIDAAVNYLLTIIIAPFYIFLFSEQAIFTISTGIFSLFLAYLAFKYYYTRRKYDIRILISRGVKQRMGYSLLTFPAALTSIIGIVTGYISGILMSAFFWIFYSTNENPDFILFHPEESQLLYYNFPFETNSNLWPLGLIFRTTNYFISTLLLVTVILVITSFYAFSNTSNELLREDFSDPGDKFSVNLIKTSALKTKLFIFIISFFVIVGIILLSSSSRDSPFLYLISVISYLLFVYNTIILLTDIQLRLPLFFQKIISNRFIIITLLSFIPIIVAVLFQLLTGLTTATTFLSIPIDFLIYISLIVIIFFLINYIDVRIELINAITKLLDKIFKKFTRSRASLPIEIFIIITLTFSMSMISAFSYSTTLEENFDATNFITGSDIKMDLNNQRLYSVVPMEHINIINSYTNVIHTTRIYLQRYYHAGIIDGVLTTKLLFINITDFRDVVKLSDEYFIGGTVEELFMKMANDSSSVLLDEIKAEELRANIGDLVSFTTNFGDNFNQFDARVVGFIKKFPPGYDTSDPEFLSQVNSLSVMSIQFATYSVASGGFSSVSGFSADENWRPTSSYLIKTRTGIKREQLATEIQQDLVLNQYLGGSQLIYIDEVIAEMEMSKNAINFQIFGTSALAILLSGFLVFNLLVVVDQYEKKALTRKKTTIDLFFMIILSLVVSWMISSLLIVFFEFQFFPETVLGNGITRNLRNLSKGVTVSITTAMIIFITSTLLAVITKSIKKTA